MSEDSAGHYGAEAKKKHGQGERRGAERGICAGEKTKLSRPGLQLSVNILS